jgi:hypothetical protein
MKTALLSLITALSLTTVTFAAAPAGSANWGQADLPQPVACPTNYPPGSPLTFVGLPGVSLTTAGGPVLLLANVETFSQSGYGFIIVDLLVDGSSIGGSLEQQFLNGAPVSLSLSRAVSVNAGAHTFGARVACPDNGDAVNVRRAWVTAYELPLIRK